MKLQSQIQGHRLQSWTVTAGASCGASAVSQRRHISISPADLTSMFVLTAISRMQHGGLPLFLCLWDVYHLQVNELEESVFIFRDEDFWSIVAIMSFCSVMLFIISVWEYKHSWRVILDNFWHQRDHRHLFFYTRLKQQCVKNWLQAGCHQPTCEFLYNALMEPINGPFFKWEEDPYSKAYLHPLPCLCSFMSQLPQMLGRWFRLLWNPW